MPAINWNDRYSVGVAEIDAQHKKLFDLINLLSETMKSGKDPKQVGQVFIELVVYTDSHFKTEERLFQKHHYTGEISHVKEHNQLRTKAMELKAKHELGSLVVTVELLNFLVSWVNKHILEEDMKYASFFKDKGVH